VVGYSPPVNLVFGPSDERYAIEGGTERLPQAIADYLKLGSGLSGNTVKEV
jgi:hypothetical protein